MINNTNDPQKKYRLGTVSKNLLLEGLNLIPIGAVSCCCPSLSTSTTLLPSFVYPVYLQDSSLWYVYTRRVENSMEPDQLASEKPCDLDKYCCYWLVSILKRSVIIQAHEPRHVISNNVHFDKCTLKRACASSF